MSTKIMPDWDIRDAILEAGLKRAATLALVAEGEAVPVPF